MKEVFVTIYHSGYSVINLDGDRMLYVCYTEKEFEREYRRRNGLERKHLKFVYKCDLSGW